MLSALGILSQSQPKLRDLKIKIINNIDDPLLYGIKDTLYLPIPTSTTGLQLRQRIHGVLHIPTERQYVFYCGSIIKDKQLIPEDAFEPFEVIALDDEVFRPRIYLLLKRENEDDEDEATRRKKADILVLHRGDYDEEAEELRRQKELMQLEADRLAKERQLLIAQLRLARDAEKEFHFDLQDELVPINCSSFYEVLLENGYDDVGAFAHVTDSALHNLHIPKKARIRLVALGAYYKQQLDAMKQRGGVRRGSHTGLSNTGTDDMSLVSVGTGLQSAATSLTSKAKQKYKNKRGSGSVASSEQVFKHKPPPQPRKHSAEMQAKIDKIRQDAKVDEYGVPLDILTHLSTHEPVKPHYCCIKHTEMTDAARLNFFASRDAFNRNKLTLLLAGLEGRGFISREVLIALLRELLIYYKYPVDSDKETSMVTIVDKSIMTPEEQNRRRNWTLPLCERMSTSQQVTAAESSSSSKINENPSPTNSSSAKAVSQRSDHLTDTGLEPLLIEDGQSEDAVRPQSSDAMSTATSSASNPGSSGGGGCLPVAVYDSAVFIEAAVSWFHELDVVRFP